QHQSMIPKKPAPHLMRGVKRFSEKIMLHQKSPGASSGSGTDGALTTRPRGANSPVFSMEHSLTTRQFSRTRLMQCLAFASHQSRQCVIPKSGTRFSEKITHEDNACVRPTS